VAHGATNGAVPWRTLWRQGSAYGPLGGAPPESGVQGVLGALMATLFRLRLGRLFGGGDAGSLLLTTWGENGKPHRTVLRYRRRNGAWALIAWPGPHATWMQNLERTGAGMVHVGMRKLAVDARFLPEGKEKNKAVKAFHGSLNGDEVRLVLGLPLDASRDAVRAAIGSLVVVALDEADAEDLR
jgi:hypothetical protein